MRKKFKKIGIFGKYHSEQTVETIKALLAYLDSHKIDYVVEKQVAAFAKLSSVPTCHANVLGEDTDLLIVVGGDGSMLRAAHIAILHDTPVLGINRGRLGFLTDILPSELEQHLGEVLAGKYHEEQRFLLSASHEHDNVTQKQCCSLNDVILLPANVAHMIEFNVYLDDDLLCHQRADGMIIATPTGSTAYSLSGGGPIIQPTMDAITLVPMFPHKLSSRPVVVSSNSTICIEISKENDSTPHINCDGRTQMQLMPGDKVTIRRSKQSLRLIHPLDYNYFATLRAKLGWQN